MSHWSKQKPHGGAQSLCEGGSVGVLQRNRTPRLCVFVYLLHRLMIRNWLMRLWRLTSPEICRVSQQAGDPGEPTVCFWSEGRQAPDATRAVFQLESKGRKSPVPVPRPPGRKNVLVRLSLGRAIFFIQSTDLNVNLTPPE